MYTVTVEASFSAVHRLRLHDGRLEASHGHDWLVRAEFSSEELDEHGMVVEFCETKRNLESVLAKLHYTDLNTNEEFAGLNPTAEVVAKYILGRLVETGSSTLRRVEVTEAPGCVASFERRVKTPVE